MVCTGLARQNDQIHFDFGIELKTKSSRGRRPTYINISGYYQFHHT